MPAMMEMLDGDAGRWRNYRDLFPLIRCGWSVSPEGSSTSKRSIEHWQGASSQVAILRKSTGKHTCASGNPSSSVRPNHNMLY